MVICRFESCSFVLNLCKGSRKDEMHVYWIEIYHVYGFSKYSRHVSLFFPKQQAFKLFVKMCNWLLTKKYISY